MSFMPSCPVADGMLLLSLQEGLAAIFQKAFRICVQDKGEIVGSKKRAIMFVVNQTCKIYFKVCTFHFIHLNRVRGVVLCKR